MKLEQAARQIIVDWDSGIHLYEAITALREALAEQAEQEPVAWMQARGDLYVSDAPDKYHTIPLYAAPVRTKDLTDDEVWGVLHDKGLMEGIRAVIAADRKLNSHEKTN